MRNPSARVLAQTCDIYPAAFKQDRGGGSQPTYGVTASLVGVPCSAQPIGFLETSDQGVLSVQKEWRIFFGRFFVVKPKDKIVFTDSEGSHTVYVHAARDEAGRGSTYSCKAAERGA